MDKNGGGVKVTYIETQFVTSDAASFKDLVQRLTGRSAGAMPHRPTPCRATNGGRSAAAGRQQQGRYFPAGEARAATAAGHGLAQPCRLEEDMYDMGGDLSELLYVGARERRLGQHGHGYSDFPY